MEALATPHTFACPRCTTEVTETYYGPCTVCRRDLRAKYMSEGVGAGNPAVVVDLRKRGPTMSGCVAVCIAFSSD